MNSQIRLHIESREPFAQEAEFGDTGPYEILKGRVYHAVDPQAPENRVIVDLDKAPRNSEGLVEFSGDVCILKPVDMSRSNGRLLHDVVNRGAMRILQFLNDATPSNDPSTPAHAGNGFLMRRGYTVVWSGWQGDLMPGNGQMTLEAAVATEGDREITGPVRAEFIAETPGVYCFPLSGNEATESYEAASLDTGQATFTYRKLEKDPRTPIPHDQWQFAFHDKAAPSAFHCYLPKGFRPGWVYELVYQAKNPKVLGLGFAAIRELIAFLRYRETDDAGATNPLGEQGSRIERAYGWGRSQSGRLLRGFVYQGFNATSQGRRVFDAIHPHVAGVGHLIMNQRFAQPGRFSRQQEDHLYPSDIFPFSYAPSTDPFTRRRDAILKRPETDPLVMHTQTSSEYWQRHGSLVHTDPLGNDLDQPEGVRIHLFASAQHLAAPGGEPQSGLEQYPSNPLACTPFIRALMDALDRWASGGPPPPSSRIPTRRDGTLVQASQHREAFPRVPGVQLPNEPNRLQRADYGPQMDEGVITQEPPDPLADQEYTVLVPQVNSDGNEIAGIRAPEVEAPLATYTGWNLRGGELGAGAMATVSGSFLPFAASEAERKENGDPRPSIERYGSREAYLQAVTRAVRKLQEEGFVLEEDVQRWIEEVAGAHGGGLSLIQPGA